MSYLDTANVWKVLDLIAAEFKSDPTSTQCFDSRLVRRAIELADQRSKARNGRPRLDPTIDELYADDPHFRRCADLMLALIQEGHLTPLEVRKAAMLAAVNYEMSRPSRPLYIPLADIRRWFDPDAGQGQR